MTKRGSHGRRKLRLKIGMSFFDGRASRSLPIEDIRNLPADLARPGGDLAKDGGKRERSNGGD